MDKDKEIAWLKYELSFIPASRRRMMQRTVLACFERDAAVAALREQGIEPPVEIGGNLTDAQLLAICDVLRKYGYTKKDKA
jgi:hypothetical protein